MPENCKKIKNQIVNEVSEMFNDLEPLSYDDVPHSFDKSGKSIQHQTAFLFKNDVKKTKLELSVLIGLKK